MGGPGGAGAGGPGQGGTGRGGPKESGAGRDGAPSRPEWSPKESPEESNEIPCWPFPNFCFGVNERTLFAQEKHVARGVRHQNACKTRYKIRHEKIVGSGRKFRRRNSLGWYFFRFEFRRSPLEISSGGRLEFRRIGVRNFVGRRLKFRRIGVWNFVGRRLKFRRIGGRNFVEMRLEFRREASEISSGGV